jgi:hypothetical protein
MPQRRRRLSSPAGCAVIPRETTKSRLPILRCAVPASDAPSIASGLSIAIEAAMVRARNGKRRLTMATIGTFKKTGSNEFTGEIVTLSVQAKGVRIVPDLRATGENAPSHRVWSAAPRSAPPGPSAPTRAATIWASSSTIRASTPRSTPTSSTTRTARAYSLIWSRPTGFTPVLNADDPFRHDRMLF